MNSERVQGIVDAAIEAIRAAGFIDDGETDRVNVRIPTVKNPVYGGIGRQAVTFGGRKRFARADGVRVTVGAQTVNFYKVGPQPSSGKPRIDSLGSASTRNLEKITAIINGLPQDGG